MDVVTATWIWQLFSSLRGTLGRLPDDRPAFHIASILHHWQSRPSEIEWIQRPPFPVEAGLWEWDL